MKVLYTNFHSGIGGGHDTYIISLLKNRHIEAHVACPASSQLYKKLKKINYPNLHAIDFSSKPKELKSIITNTQKLIRLINEKDIDIVHTNGSPDNRMVLYASFFSKKIKVVFTKHNTHPIKGLISKFRLKYFNDAIILVSFSIKKIIPINKENKKLSVIPNGIDLNRWQPAYQDPKQVLHLVSIAGTSDYKGWHFLIEALKNLSKDEIARLKVTIVGNMPCDTKIAEVFGDSDVIKAVEFTGYLDDPSPILAVADVGFVLSNAIETISFACREMMAAGLPIIVSDYSGLPENITNEKDGWIVPTGNVDKITETLSKILKLDSQTLLEMKHSAREKAENSFSLETMIDDTQQIYNSVMLDQLT